MAALLIYYLTVNLFYDILLALTVHFSDVSQCMTDAFRRVAAVNIRKVYSNIKADRQLHLSILGAIGWFSGTIAFMALRLLQSSSYETPFDGQQAPRHNRRPARVARCWRKDWKKSIFPCKVCILNFSESVTCMEFWR